MWISCSKKAILPATSFLCHVMLLNGELSPHNVYYWGTLCWYALCPTFNIGIWKHFYHNEIRNGSVNLLESCYVAFYTKSPLHGASDCHRGYGDIHLPLLLKYLDGLVQNCYNSIDNALELLLSYH